MKEIPLTQGQIALVDDVDYDWLNQYKWFAHKNHSGNFYAARHSPGKDGKQLSISMAREILGLKQGDPRQADHIHRITLDNRRNNIRICTHQQNQRNRKPFSNTTSKFRGVHWDKRKRKWRASITVNGKSRHLGYFDVEEDAAGAYDRENLSASTPTLF